MNQTIDGLVVREVAWGENDKRLVLLTAERGRVSVLAKGARSLKSKYGGCAQLFTYGNFELVERNGYTWMKGASPIQSFWGLRDSIDSVALASYIVELVGELTGEEVFAENILRLTLNTLYAISMDFKHPRQIKATFELRALALSGYMPDLSECDLCKKTRDEYMYLDVMNGILKCPDCVRVSSSGVPLDADERRTNIILVPLSMQAISAARYIMEAPLEKVLSVKLSDEVIAELGRFGETYAIHHLEKRLPSLDFYYDIVGNSFTTPS